MAKNKKKRRSMGTGAAKAAAAAKSNFDYINMPSGMPLFKEDADSTTKLDILPYIVKNVSKHPDGKFIPDDIWWRFPFKLLRAIGPDKKNVISPITIGKACPVVEERSAIYDDPDGDNDVARALRPSPRYLYIVIPRGHKKYKEVPHLWNISGFCFQEQLDKELELGDEAYTSFADLEGGYTLKVRFTEEKLGKNSFAKCDRIDFVERDDIDEDILDDLPDLADCITIPTYEQVKAIFYGMDEEEGDAPEEEEEDPKPKKERPKKSAKKKTAKKKEPEPEPEEEEEEEEEVTECPDELNFGMDYDEYDVCESCEVAKECKAAKAALSKKPPKKAAPKKAGKKDKDEGPKCPKGHIFGSIDDHDMHDEDCDDCELWDECGDACG